MSVSLDTMLARVAGNISRYNMFPLGGRVGVAVSGGADSVCLLHLLVELAPLRNVHLSVLHVDHGIRAEASRADAEFVAQMAAGFGLPFLLRTGNVREMAEQNRDNLEQAAREFRRNFFSEVIRQGVLDRVATGHTRDDQAETVLFRFLRGSGTAGLAGIHPVTDEGLVRPMLDVSREEVETYLREKSIRWREDESNYDLSFTRNRIRHELLPALRSQYNPRIGDALVRMAILAREDEQYWNGVVTVPTPQNGMILLKTGDLASIPAALARRVLRRCIETLKGDLHQIGFDHIDAILELARASEGSGRFQAGGIEFWRSFDWVRIRVPVTRSRPDFEEEVSIPGEVRVDAEKLCLKFNLRAAKEPGCDTVREVRYLLSWEKIHDLLRASGGTLTIRNWRPGDRYCPSTRRDEKIKQMFQDYRVPIWDRAAWPVLALADRILWARKFGPAEGLAPDGDTETALCICDETIVSI